MKHFEIPTETLPTCPRCRSPFVAILDPRKPAEWSCANCRTLPEGVIQAEHVKAPYTTRGNHEIGDALDNLRTVQDAAAIAIHQHGPSYVFGPLWEGHCKQIAAESKTLTEAIDRAIAKAAHAAARKA